MQHDLTDKLAEKGEPPFQTNSSVPVNVPQMSLRQLKTFVLSLQEGSTEMSDGLRARQKVADHTFCICAVNGSKDGHDNDGMRRADVRPRCVLEHCGAIVKVGAMSTKGPKHPAGRYGTLPCLLYICIAR
jgi:hypothetical protein